MNRRKFLALASGVLVAAVVPVEVFAEALPAYRAPIAEALSGYWLYDTTNCKIWARVGGAWTQIGEMKTGTAYSALLAEIEEARNG